MSLKRLLHYGVLCALTGVVVAACGSSSSKTTSSSSKTTSGKSAPLAHLLPADIRNSGTLVVATDAAYPPCEYFPSPGAPVRGFDVDIWNAVGQKLGVRMKMVNTDFNGLIPGVQSGRYPMAMECISDSHAREKQVRFVDFMVDKTAVYTTQNHAGRITTDPLSLCGLRAAAQSGTDYVGSITHTLSPNCVKHGKPPITVSQFPAESDVLLALYSGRVDFVLADLPAVEYLKRKAPKPVVVRTDRLLSALYLGIVVKKDNTQLAHALLAATNSIVADGTFDKIFTKWNINDLKLAGPPGINLCASHPHGEGAQAVVC